jgi:FG-GAP-like repeat
MVILKTSGRVRKMKNVFRCFGASKVTRFFTAFVTIASFVIPDIACAQWSYRAAPDPLVRSVRVFANTPLAGSSTLIVSTLTNGMYKGVDNGSAITWQSINQGLPTLRIITSTASDVNTLYAGTSGSGIYKSTNGGTSWTSLNGSGGGALGCKVVRAIALGAGNTIYAGTACRYNSGMYVSADGGLNWSRLATTFLPDDVRVQSIFLNGTLMIITTIDHGIFRSVDSGATFIGANGGLVGVNVFSVTTHSIGTAGLVAYVHGYGVYRSNDTGTTWTISNTGLPSGFAALGGISREGTSTLYIGTDKRGIYRSTDGGLTWSLWAGSGPNTATAYARNVTVDTTVAGKYYIGTLEGLVRTADSGNTFVISNMGGGGEVNAITHDRLNPATAYLATASPRKIADIYSDNYAAAGISVDIGSGIAGTMTDGVVYQDSVDAALLYATTNNYGIFKSTNGGNSWAEINAGLPSMIGHSTRLAIDRNNPQMLYLGIDNNLGVYKSSNGGASWTASNFGLSNAGALSIHMLSIDGNATSTIFAATDAGLYRSGDGGATWALRFSALDGGGKPLPIGQVRVDPSNSLIVYLTANHQEPSGVFSPSAGLHKSVDGGFTWTNVFPGNAVSAVRALTNGEVYVGLSADVGQPAVYRSSNGGATWLAAAKGLRGSDIRTFGVKSDASALLSLSLENGFYTANLSKTNDLSGDGVSDIVYKDALGAIGVNLMSGVATTATANILPASAGWAVSHVADFDGDGKADLLVKNSDGRIVILLMDGTSVVSSTQLVGAGSGYTPVVTGDFNGDGRADIVLKNTDGSAAVLLMNGVSVLSAGFVLGTGSPWNITHAGDFDGDGRTDLIIRNNDGSAAVLIMNGAVVTGASILLSVGGPWSVTHVADLSGDGKSDVIIKNTDGSTALLLMNGTTVTSAAFLLTPGSPYTVTHVGDFNGDGKADLLIRNTDGSVVILQMNGTVVSAAAFLLLAGSTTTVAQVADYNGDGKSDILLRNADGSATAILMNGAVVTAAGTVWGPGTLQVVP